MTLTMSVEMPDSFTLELRSLLTGLLQRDVHKRLGCRGRGAEEIKSHPFFRGIDWRVVFLQRLPPPLIPARGEVNAADAFDIGSFDDEDTKHIRLSEADQELYRNFPVVVSERWQHEIAETIFDYINHEADKAEMKRKNKHKLGYQEEEQSDCILHGYIKRLGGTFTATWLTRYVRLYPNRLELWSDSGKQPELIFMDQIEEVCNDYVQIKNEQCIVIKLYNHSKYVFTNSDEIGLKEWHVSLKAAHKDSMDMMTTMAEKATKIYGTEIPLKHMGKRRQQLQLEANSNSAIANLEQKIIQKELQASSRSPEVLAANIKQQQQHTPMKGVENVCPAARAARAQAPPAGHSHAQQQHQQQQVPAHKYHRGHHQHRTHHHRHHHHTKHSAAAAAGAGGALGGWSTGPVGHYHHRHATSSSRHLARSHPATAASAGPSQSAAAAAAAEATATINQEAPEQRREQTRLPQEKESAVAVAATATSSDKVDSAIFTGDGSSAASADAQDKEAQKQETAKEKEQQQQHPTVATTTTASTTTTSFEQSDKQQPTKDQKTGNVPQTEPANKTPTPEATTTTAAAAATSTEVVQQSNSIDSSSSGRSGSCSTSSEASGEEAALAEEEDDEASDKTMEQQQQQQTTQDSKAPEQVSLQVTAASLEKRADESQQTSGTGDKATNEQDCRPRLALSLENVSEHQEVLRDPSKRITSDNKQREQDLVAQYEKLHIGARDSSSSIEEEVALPLN